MVKEILKIDSVEYYPIQINIYRMLYSYLFLNKVEIWYRFITLIIPSYYFSKRKTIVSKLV